VSTPEPTPEPATKLNREQRRREQRRREPIEKQGHSVTDTAAMLDVTRPTIYKLLAEGRLRSQKLGTRRIITAKSIDDLLNSWTPAPPRRHRGPAKSGCPTELDAESARLCVVGSTLSRRGSLANSGLRTTCPRIPSPDQPELTSPVSVTRRRRQQAVRRR
jgi:excisionase family DNA binding protein